MYQRLFGGSDSDEDAFVQLNLAIHRRDIEETNIMDIQTPGTTIGEMMTFVQSWGVPPRQQYLTYRDDQGRLCQIIQAEAGMQMAEIIPAVPRTHGVCMTIITFVCVYVLNKHGVFHLR